MCISQLNCEKTVGNLSEGGGHVPRWPLADDANIERDVDAAPEVEILLHKFTTQRYSSQGAGKFHT